MDFSAVFLHNVLSPCQTCVVVVVAARYVFNEVNNRFPSLPFSLRALEDEKQVGVESAIARLLLLRG